MSKFILAAWVMVAALGVGNAFADASSPEDAGHSAADQWLALVDAGKYSTSWTQMDSDFKNEVSKRKWKSAIAEIRKPLGAVASRVFQSATYSKELPGAPEGEYVVVQYTTTFAHKNAAAETVTLRFGDDLIWHVSSYLVK
jgi:Protein of unknown function (DUF4019)